MSITRKSIALKAI